MQQDVKIQNDNASANAVRLFLRSEDALLLILGERGTGKTALLTETVKRSRISRHVIRLRAHTTLQPSQLTKLLATHWNVKITNPEAKLEDQLRELLMGLCNHEQPCVLVVDDAHHLPFSVLAALSHLAELQEEVHAHLHLLLSGHPGLLNKMENLQTKPIPHIHLKTALEKTVEEPIEESIEKPNLISHNTWWKNKVRIGSTTALAVFCAFMWWFYQKPHDLAGPMLKPQLHAAAHSTSIPAPNTSKKQHQVTQTGRVTAALMHQKPIVHKPKRFQIIAATIMHQKPSQVMAKKPGYTLQLMSGADQKALRTFIERHHLTQKAETVRTTYKGNTWYLLTYGHYDNTDAAHHAIQGLPPRLKRMHPWVRPEKTT